MGDAMTSGLIEKCLNNGIRMTSQRQIILEVIEGSEDHPDVDQLHRRSVEQDRTISIATVYPHSLHTLCISDACPVAI